MAAGASIDLGAILGLDRQRVKYGTAEFEIRHPAELTYETRMRVSRLGQRIEKNSAAAADPEIADADADAATDLILQDTDSILSLIIDGVVGGDVSFAAKETVLALFLRAQTGMNRRIGETINPPASP